MKQRIRLVIAIMLACALIFSVSGECNYEQQLQFGQVYDVFSPKYPDNPYPAGSQCTWYATSAPGSKINVSCTDMRLPWSLSCTGDRLDISYTGSLKFDDAQHYCINQSFSNASKSNKLSIRLKTATYGDGGFFRCQLQLAKIEPQLPLLDGGSSSSLHFTALASTASRAPSYSQCGRRKTARIVGGSTTIVNEFPMMAGLVQGKVASVYCGAIIVNQWFAVTAAHCLHRKTTSTVRLLVGEHDYSSGSDTPYARLHALHSFRVHSGYSGGDLNDIALVRTTHAIKYNVAVGPVCLPYGHDSMVGKHVEAVGWGTLSFGGKVSTVLKKVTLKVISNAQCIKSFGKRLHNSHLCTFTKGRDACQRDSGGPMFYTAGGLVYLAGIISFGSTCADNKPSVSTRVTHYADWIRQHSK